jgi:hypothetical protein
MFVYKGRGSVDLRHLTFKVVSSSASLLPHFQLLLLLINELILRSAYVFSTLGTLS